MAPPPPGTASQAVPSAPTQDEASAQAAQAAVLAATRGDIDPSTKYRELGTIKVLAAMFMFICMALNIVFMIWDPSTQQIDATQMGTIGGIAALACTAVGIGLGIMAIFMNLKQKFGPYPVRIFLMMMSPLFILIGAGVKRTIMSVGAINYVDLALAIVFGVFFILFIEYLHAVWRFTSIGKMAIERNLKDFDFGHVIRHYMGFGGGVLGIIVVLSVVVVFLRNGILAMMSGTPQLTSSVEMNSVYGLAISSAIIFTILGITLSFWFGSRDYAASIRAVSSFSKEKMRQMSDEGKTTGRPRAAPTSGIVTEIPKS
jgi:hypothetical protein